MSRMVSLGILLAVILVVGAMFILVMAQFLVPLFLALLLVVLFQPLHEWFLRKLNGRAHIAALFTTMSIILIVLTPLLIVLSQAATQGIAVISPLIHEEGRQEVLNNAQELLGKTRRYADRVGIQIPENQELLAQFDKQAKEKIPQIAASLFKFFGSFVAVSAIMLVALYFFLADGPAMVKSLMPLIPLDPSYQQQMLDQFVSVSRAVVMATLLASIIQGLVAGVAYYFTGLGNIALLAVATMFLSMVPFIGAASVWGSCSLYLLSTHHTTAAIFLALWGLIVVSNVDNLVKPWVLRGQSNLHPLLALLSILGGISALGPIGILVGPMVVSFLQALLNMLRTELEVIEKGSPPKIVETG